MSGLIPGVTRDHQGVGSPGLGESDVRWVRHPLVHRGVRSDDVKPVLDAARRVEPHQVPDVALMCAGALDSGLRSETARVRENALAPVPGSCGSPYKAPVRCRAVAH